MKGARSWLNAVLASGTSRALLRSYMPSAGTSDLCGDMLKMIGSDNDVAEAIKIAALIITLPEQPPLVDRHRLLIALVDIIVTSIDASVIDAALQLIPLVIDDTLSDCLHGAELVNKLLWVVASCSEVHIAANAAFLIDCIMWDMSDEKLRSLGNTTLIVSAVIGGVDAGLMGGADDIASPMLHCCMRLVLQPEIASQCAQCIVFERPNLIALLLDTICSGAFDVTHRVRILSCSFLSECLMLMDTKMMAGIEVEFARRVRPLLFALIEHCIGACQPRFLLPLLATVSINLPTQLAPMAHLDRALIINDICSCISSLSSSDGVNDATQLSIVILVQTALSSTDLFPPQSASHEIIDNARSFIDEFLDHQPPSS